LSEGVFDSLSTNSQFTPNWWQQSQHKEVAEKTAAFLSICETQKMAKEMRMGGMGWIGLGGDQERI